MHLLAPEWNCSFQSTSSLVPFLTEKTCREGQAHLESRALILFFPPTHPLQWNQRCFLFSIPHLISSFVQDFNNVTTIPSTAVDVRKNLSIDFHSQMKPTMFKANIWSQIICDRKLVTDCLGYINLKWELHCIGMAQGQLQHRQRIQPFCIPILSPPPPPH